MNRLTIGLLSSIFGSVLVAQQWSVVERQPDLAASAAAWDSARDRIVLATTHGETYEHDGTIWSKLGDLPVRTQQPVAPLLAYQAHRGRTLALVNRGADFATFEYDGSAWRQRQPDTVPSVREDPGICYDSVRQRVVLFGGDGQALRNDTWEWDGADWQLRTVTVSPPPRSLAAMGFDPTRGVTVLFGGRAPVGFHDDHWEWDGSSWTQRQFSVRPAARSRSQLAHDPVRNRMVLIGGYSGAGGVGAFFERPWEFDGQAWTLAATNLPGGGIEHAVVGVANGVRIYGGGNPFIIGGSAMGFRVFDYDGSAFRALHGWSAKTVRLAYDAGRNRTVAVTERASFFPPSEVYEWDGEQVRPSAVTGTPSRAGFGLADALAGEIVLFGGRSVSGFEADTWAFNGTSWTQKSVTGPAARQLPAMATDPVRGVVVLHGGVDAAFQPFGDTWEWDGTMWNPRTVPGPGPGAQSGAGMAFDANLAACVMTGGRTPSNPGISDTWAFDGTAWTLLNSNGGSPFLAWHANRGEVLMLVRQARLPGFSSTFTLRGGNWVAATSVPESEFLVGLAADPDGNVVGFGGATQLAASVFSDLPALIEDRGPACSNIGPLPRLAMRDLPRLGARLRYELIGAQPSQPAVFFASHRSGVTSVGPCRLELQLPTVVGIGATNSLGQSGLALDIPNVVAVRGVSLGVVAAAGEVGGPIAGSVGATSAKWGRIGF